MIGLARTERPDRPDQARIRRSRKPDAPRRQTSREDCRVAMGRVLLMTVDAGRSPFRRLENQTGCATIRVADMSAALAFYLDLGCEVRQAADG